MIKGDPSGCLSSLAGILCNFAFAIPQKPRFRDVFGQRGTSATLLIVFGIGTNWVFLACRCGRTGQLWTWEGRLNIRNSRFQDDPRPVDAECRCETCRTFSRAYLAHLFRAEELLAYRLATVHNLTYTLDLMRGIRAALADGSFASLRDGVQARYGNAESRTKRPITDR